MDKLTMILQFIIGLSIIVGIHELGHMLIAKMFGIRVEHFMIGFPPKIFKFKYKETEYALGAVPLGGSAKIAGMVDESFEKKGLESAPQPWEYRSKPRWQRLLVILGGIIFNMIFGVLLFITITYYTGTSYITKKELNKNGICPTLLGKELGFKSGDRIIKLNGSDFKSFEELQDISIFLKNKTYYKILRDNEAYDIYIPKKILKSLNSSKSRYLLFEPLFEYKIENILKSSNAKAAGLRKNDIIISINDISTKYIQTLKEELIKNKGKHVYVKYLRNETIYSTIMQIENNGKIGIEIKRTIKFYHQKFTILQSIPYGIKTAFSVVWTNILAIKNMIVGNLSFSKSVKGPIGIIQEFGKTFSWLKFWRIVAFLSMVIAFTNLLPIPALDGGHMVFILYEMITRKSLSTKTMFRFQIVGSVILLSIIAYTVLNDIIKLFK
ncbi:MAG: RIP metalloprotease RseP [Bacteroidetes bacterium]|nr:RIP metalloprotease RseP [Bacteroidota bacterium]